MAVTSKPNEEYYLLKTRFDKWAVFTVFIYPLFSGIILVFGSSFLGNRLNPQYGYMIGFIVGGLLWQTTGLYLCISKLGFILRSKEKCQSCRTAIAYWNGFGFSIDYLCRKCGNNNSIELTR